MTQELTVEQCELAEMFSLCHELIQEAKGGAGDVAYVTNHLDDAENWLDKIEAAFARHRTEALATSTDVMKLRGALIDHNDALRSAQQVASRDGKDTNWKTFRGHCTWVLAEHHELVNAAREALSSLPQGEEG